jgi:hypothetical protein
MLLLTQLKKIDRIIMGLRLLRVVVLELLAMIFASACSGEKLMAARSFSIGQPTIPTSRKWRAPW